MDICVWRDSRADRIHVVVFLRWSTAPRGRGNMKPISIAGIVLVVVGLFALAYQGITYTKRERVVDVGPIHATKDTKETIPLPPVLGGIALVAGIVLLVAGSKSSA
jgi:hypothetical protein